MHLNPKSGKWEPDLSHNQRHVSADIFYNVWRYYEATGDFEFLLDHGRDDAGDRALLVLHRHFNPERDRYEIHGVMGPDEFHEKYPDSEEEVSNNAYTNVMVAWLSEIARRCSICSPSGVGVAARQDRLRTKKSRRGRR